MKKQNFKATRIVCACMCNCAGHNVQKNKLMIESAIVLRS